MSISGRSLLALTHAVRGSRTLKMLEAIQSEPYRPRSEIMQRHFERLSAILAISEAHVPYYREMFRSLGIRARDIRNLRDFALLPILTKEAIRQRLDDFVREDVSKDKLIAVHSGGSTGVPLKFYRTRNELDICEAGFFRKVFACPVYDSYGSSEIHNIACACPRGRMHVNLDNAVLETDRSDAPPGQPSTFIVTSLGNEVMPFIRYRNEDCGELVEDTCDCGNQFPLMELDITRIFDHFILPDGRFVHGMLFTRVMDVAHGISTFQFHQTAPDSITLWIAPGPGDSFARDKSLQEIAKQVRNLDPEGRIKVQARTTSAIPLSTNGKHRYVRSDVRAQTLRPDDRQQAAG